MILRRVLEILRPGGRKVEPAEGTQAVGDPVEYGGFIVRAAPRRDDGGWRVAGEISKRDSDGELRVVHRFVRVDMYPSRDAAAELAVMKGRQIINEQGDALLETPPA